MANTTTADISSDVSTYGVVGKGMYGCVFYPSINVCDGSVEDEDSSHYVTKIQRVATETKQELVICKKIKTIPHYEYFFSPVIKQCSVNIKKIDYHLVKTCRFMQNDLGELDRSSKYISNTILCIMYYVCERL